MSQTVDFLIVGSGLTGATIARTLSDLGYEVLILERKNHFGGNVHDHLHPSGIRIHTYGPHYFRTNSDEIWSFVNRFGDFCPYEAVVKTLVDGQMEPWPITAEMIRRVAGVNWQPIQNDSPANFEEACLTKMPRIIYEKFVRGYTEKQWGTQAKNLSAGLASRLEVRQDTNPRFSQHKYQGIPRAGYTAFMRNMLAKIPVVLNCDFQACRNIFRTRKMLIFTGAIDEFFSYDLGKLEYRAQRREHVFLEDAQFAQICGQINNPDPRQGDHIRTLEWKHMMPPDCVGIITGTVLTREHPYTPQETELGEYPFPDARNERLYQAYRERAATIQHLLICGRLGEYRYFDMDQAIGRALRLARQIVISVPLGLQVVGRPSCTNGRQRPDSFRERGLDHDRVTP